MSSAEPSREKPIIVGVDEGPGQEHLVLFAAREAALRGRPLHIAHAIPLPLSGLVGGPDDGGEGGPAAREGAHHLRRFEDLARSAVPEVTVAGELPLGHAAAVLVERSRDAEMIVIGHRGSGGFPRLPLGSVSWQVATHAQCPVIVVRPGAAEEPDRPGAGRVVVGVDTGDASLDALDLAYVEAELRGARLELVHGAFSPGMVPTGPIGMVPPDFATLDQGARDFLTKEIDRRRHRHPAVQAELRIEHTRPATLLAEASRDASLLVVGSRGRTGLRRLLLGSVSAEVLHTAECPVAVTPAPDALDAAPDTPDGG
ncbi:universal stress protein [Streptomyces sp. DH12]|uniref:universal stress protein n=1 Tax=Streptomyces sp. DH12 TaxID=2857010 RepID=UPI001E4D32CA|nr:universal stress protein [Streptomyces sp. DH12]